MFTVEQSSIKDAIQCPMPGERRPGIGRPIPGVEVSGDRSHEFPEWLQLFKIGVSDEPPGSHNVVVEPPVDEPKERKHLMV